MNNLIQWPRAKYWDKSWNPIVGCRPCSPACKNCYAAAWARRFRQSFKPHFKKKLQKVPNKGVVFCGNMTDLFGDWFLFPEDSLIQVFQEQYKTAQRNRNAVYLWLTKRPVNMFRAANKMVDGVGNSEWSHHYFGFTVENQEWFEKRLVGCPIWSYATKIWLSCEPLLGPIDLKLMYPGLFGWINWVVVGCESGPKRRPCKIEWVESIVDQCRAAKVPVFVKQLDIGGKCVTDINQFPAHLRIRQVPWAMERMK